MRLIEHTFANGTFINVGFGLTKPDHLGFYEYIDDQLASLRIRVLWFGKISAVAITKGKRR